MSSSVTVGDVTMDYLTFGTGTKPMVILPGVSLFPVLRSAPAIEATFRRFSDRHTVWLFDRRRNMPEDYSVSDMADDTAAAMRALGLSDVHLYGVSQGGMIAQSLTARNPDLVSRLAIASTICRPNEVSRETFSRWVSLSESGDRVAWNRFMFSLIYSPDYLKKYERAFDALAKMGSDEDYRRLAILCRACLTFDGDGEVGRITCPVLAVGSEQDHVLSGEGSREIAERLGGKLILYPDYSHAVYDEAPDFLDHIARFFDETDEKTGG
ncbi:MAG: alpha/beta hydrolase [Ruminococcus sp.]|nr:alpha/beta hydrolase [Candidatus Apopatosoma intestinale]